MAITYGPSGFEDLFAGLVQLGQGAIKRMDRDRVRQMGIQDEIRKNPEILQNIALAAQRAQEAGLDPREFIAKNFDMDPKTFGSLIQGFKPNIDTATSDRLVDTPGAVDTIAGSVIAGAEAETATANVERWRGEAGIADSSVDGRR